MVMELFAELVSPERAIILVTHDLGVADTTDRKVSMRDGKIISDERKTAAF
jgi:ABC-type lipoprotein export system ATPase subunit